MLHDSEPWFFLGWQQCASVGNRVNRKFQEIFFFFFNPHTNQDMGLQRIQCHWQQSRRFRRTVTRSFISHIAVFVLILFSLALGFYPVASSTKFINSPHHAAVDSNATLCSCRQEHGVIIHTTTAGSGEPAECVERDRARWKRPLGTGVDSEAAPLPCQWVGRRQNVWGTWGGDVL